MTKTVCGELIAIWQEAFAKGENPRFGQRRLAGRFAEFGLPDDYAVAEAAVDCAINNKRNAINNHRVIVARLTDAVGFAMPDSHYPELPADRLEALAAEAATDAVAWAACQHVAVDAIQRGLPVPLGLVTWAANAWRDTTRPDARKAKWQTQRDDAIRFAVRLALESGAFKGATHSKDKKKPAAKAMRGGRELDDWTLSACDLVAHRMSNAGIGIALDYADVAKVWAKRDRTLDVSETIKK